MPSIPIDDPAVGKTPDKTWKSRFRRWVVNPILEQLKRGITPEKISLSIALGITLGIFPIMGTTTVVCILFGWLLKLNQGILHLFKTFAYPLQLLLILIFIRLGQQLNGAPLIRLSIPEMMTRFKDSPAQFGRDFGMAALYGIEAWAIAAIILIPLIRMISLYLIRKTLIKRAQKKEVTP